MLGSKDNGVPVLQTRDARRRRVVMPLLIAVVVGIAAVLLAFTTRSGPLVGSGSTLAQPLVEGAMGAYRDARNADNPQRPAATGGDWVLDGETLDYEPVGSLGGILRLQERGVTFAVSDYPVSADALRQSDLVQFPITVGSVAVVHNLDLDGGAPLKLDATTLADIYRGTITTWNDPAIAALNPGVTLPKTPITPVHRSDGSGSTFALTTYLAAGSPEWKSGPGAGSVVSWPGGTAAERSDGLIETVRATPGAVGYVDQGQAARAGLHAAAVGNRSGSFTTPTQEGMSAAIRGVDWSGQDDYTRGLPTSTDRAAYPLTVAVYALVHRSGSEPDTRRALAFLAYLMQGYADKATSLGYHPLPDEAVESIHSYWANRLGVSA